MFFLRELPTRRMLEGYADSFPDMDIDAMQQALALLRRASVLMRRLDRHFTEHDSSQLRFLILVVIDREPNADRLTVGEIGRRLDVSKPVMTRTLSALATAGMVAISRDEGDARSKQVRLTEKGRRALHAILPGYYRIISDFMTEDPA